jgi:hypothetical protein
MRDGANRNLDGVPRFGDHRKMFLLAGLNRVRNQLRHLLATADQGDALVQHKTYEISTMFADKKFVHN